MQPHSSQSNRENTTPSGGASPLVSYKEVLSLPTPPPPLNYSLPKVASKVFHHFKTGQTGDKMWKTQ